MKIFYYIVIIILGLNRGIFSENPVEIGKIRWERDLDTALKNSKQSKRPVFLLFQEVPGCSGCQKFGREVLSDPEVVKGVEESFIPVFIYNNRSGKDTEILKRFQEPAWNYQVIRFLDSDGKDLIEREEGVWTREALVKRMKKVLEISKSVTPVETQPLISKKELKMNHERVAFAQGCFWTGEMSLGGIEGVNQTEVGFMQGNEVTVVDYDPQVISLKKLIERAMNLGVADRIYLTSEKQKEDVKVMMLRSIYDWSSDYRRAPHSDQKRQIQGTQYENHSLSPEQATKVNAFVRRDPQRVIEYLK